MSNRCAAVPGNLTLQQLVDEHILGGSQRCFLVTRGQDTGETYPVAKTGGTLPLLLSETPLVQGVAGGPRIRSTSRS